LSFTNCAFSLERIRKQRKVHCNLGADTRRKTSWKVFKKTTSIDEGTGLDIHLCWCKKRVTDSLVRVLRARAVIVQPLLLDKLAHKTEAIAMYATARKTEKNVTATNPTRKNAISVDSTHTKASKIIIARCIYRGHLCRFPSNQAAVGPPAFFSDPFHNCGSLFDLKMTHAISIDD
jgi:hypothetical protein